MGISRSGGVTLPRYPQGPNSKMFHFNAPLCKLCNNSRTQPADIEFDRFHSELSSLVACGKESGSIFEAPHYQKNTPAYLNIFRYFAKLLCCHIAESEGPRFLNVCMFAIGQSDDNYIDLKIQKDPMYEAVVEHFDCNQFLSHGGLGVVRDENTGLLNEFRTALTIGEIKYCVCIRFDGDTIGLELQKDYPEFWEKCQIAYDNRKIT